MHLQAQFIYSEDWKGHFFNSPSDIIVTTASWVSLVVCGVYISIPVFIVYRYRDKD